jgi:SAM-dependent methyltransferase
MVGLFVSTEIENAVNNFSKTLPDGSKILDLGCGLKPYQTYFKNMQYVGIDVEESGRNKDDKLTDVQFDGISIPFNDAEFDACICTEVLEHAVDPDALLMEVNRVLKNGGSLLITVPFMWGLHELPYDFRRYTLFGLSKAVAKCGFSVELEERLTAGSNAILAIINSELNNYLNNVVFFKDLSLLRRLAYKLVLLMHKTLIIFLGCLWKGAFKFERVYLDNLLVARKLK